MDRREIVLAGIDAFNEQNVDAFIGSLHPEVQWVEDPAYPGAATYSGPQGVRESLAKWWETWVHMDTRFERFVEMGDSLVALGHVTVQSATTELDFDTEWGAVYDFADGLVVRVRFFATHADALRAAGLPES